jgi:hypothetical protein
VGITVIMLRRLIKTMPLNSTAAEDTLFCSQLRLIVADEINLARSEIPSLEIKGPHLLLTLYHSPPPP